MFFVNKNLNQTPFTGSPVSRRKNSFLGYYSHFIDCVVPFFPRNIRRDTFKISGNLIYLEILVVFISTLEVKRLL